ncbi:MAG: hypothetical protein QM572_14840 [Nocardioides sp.]|uniref:hypothetical protein n=1 Tax=Nocardioides sp. TaxID=35761 RepID=UPI0039E514BA
MNAKLEAVSTVTEQADTAPTRRRTVAIAVALVVLLVVAGGAWALLRGGDETAPYADDAATGRLTLCDADGKAVTEGAIKDAPFAAYVVGSTAAPAAYQGASQTASLYAYQPREGHAADEFSGQILAASSRYTSTAHPAAQVTDQSSTLADFVAAYPAEWDGFVELRLILTVEGNTPRASEYDALDLQIEGDRWHVVGATGGADCAGVADTTSNAIS